MALLAALPGAISRPFSALGGLTRITSTLVFTRSRQALILMRRSRIDYRAELGDPLANSIVGAVVGWVSRNFPEAPVRIIREDDPEGKPIVRSSTGPGAMLRLLEKPNSFWSGPLLWMAVIVDFVAGGRIGDEGGNAYIYKLRGELDRVVELWWLPAAHVRPWWNPAEPTAFIDAYVYNVDGIQYVLDPANVIHLRNGLNPWDQGRTGRSPLRSLLREIFTDEEAAQFTASLLHNLGVPGVILAPANTTGIGQGKAFSADTEAVKRKFAETFGGDNRGDPLVFSTPTDVKVLSWNPQQMDLKALRRIPEERISAVIGVPAGVAGLGAGLDRNTFTNYAEANKAAYTQAVIPLQRLIAAELESQLLPEFVTRAIELYDVIFDASATAAMAETADAVWLRALSAYKGGAITRASFKRLTKQKVADDGSDDVYLIANNIRVIDAGGNSPRVVLPAAPSPGGAGAVEISTPVRALLGPGPVRCSNASCGAFLAELAAAPYRFTCRKCKTVTASDVLDVVGVVDEGPAPPALAASSGMSPALIALGATGGR